ncbi:hypothetical protein M432DRAFT_33670 [Thermoascus aurantiacus ATCC 26904]
MYICGELCIQVSNRRLGYDSLNFNLFTFEYPQSLLPESLWSRTHLRSAGDSVNDLTSYMEPIMIGQDSGDLSHSARKIFRSSHSEALLHFFRFCVYLSSNNMMSGSATTRLLCWVTNGFRFMLQDMFKSKTTTVEIFTSNLLATAAMIEDVETTKIIIGAGVDIDAPSGLATRRTALQTAVEVGNVGLVQMLLKGRGDCSSGRQTTLTQRVVSLPISGLGTNSA